MVSGIFGGGGVDEAPIVFGQTSKSHRYKMPLLPGEKGVKSGGNWVPGHMRSATNLAGAISESFALGQWEREQGQMGLALRPDLYEMLVIEVRRAQLAGVNFQKLGESAAGKALKGALKEIQEEARQTAGGNKAAQEGTNRHTVWEERGATGQLVGTPAINAQIEELEALLKRCHLQRVPELSERVVRNTDLNCAGRFDDVLLHTTTGQLYMADLKSKRRPFFSLLELWIQLYVYASADQMLSHIGDDAFYQAGPKYHVSQKTALILHMPANSGEEGAEPMRIRRLDLEKGKRWAELASLVVQARSDGKSVESMTDSFWPEDVDLESWKVPTLTS